MTGSQPSPMDATRDKGPGRESVVPGAPRRSLDATAIQATPPRQLNHTDAATRQHIRAAGPRRLMTDSALRPAKSNSLAHDSGPQQPNSDAVGLAKPKIPSFGALHSILWIFCAIFAANDPAHPVFCLWKSLYRVFRIYRTTSYSALRRFIENQGFCRRHSVVPKPKSPSSFVCIFRQEIAKRPQAKRHSDCHTRGSPALSLQGFEPVAFSCACEPVSNMSDDKSRRCQKGPEANQALTVSAWSQPPVPCRSHHP